MRYMQLAMHGTQQRSGLISGLSGDACPFTMAPNPATSSELKVRSVLMSTLPCSLFQVAQAKCRERGRNAIAVSGRDLSALAECQKSADFPGPGINAQVVVEAYADPDMAYSHTRAADQLRWR